MNYAYIRVSTENQNLENQKITISQKYNIGKWYFEKRSGCVDYHVRKLNGLIDEMQKGDVLIVTELSRLGRSIIMIFDIVSKLQKKGCGLIAIKNNFNLSCNSLNDIVSQTMIFAFGLSAQIERQLISERTKQGLIVAKMKGKRIGRQKGDTIYFCKLRKYETEIINKRNMGQSINSLSKEYNVNWQTMKNFFTKYINMKKPLPLKNTPKKHGHPTNLEIEYFKNTNA